MGTLLFSQARDTTQHLTMNRFLFFSSLVAISYGAVVPAALPLAAGPVAAAAPLAASPYLVRAPAHDSASIEHHRLGGNFAYSTAESHAFAEVTPQISTLTHPPAKIATHQPAPIVRTHHVAQPIFQDVPVHAQVPVTGPIARHQTVHQPVVHETRTHTVQAVAHAAPVAVAHAAAPIAVAHAAPAAVAAAPIAVAHAEPAALSYAAGYPLAHAGYAAAAGLPLAHAAGLPVAAIH